MSEETVMKTEVIVTISNSCNPQSVDKLGSWLVTANCPDRSLFKQWTGSQVNTTNNLMELEGIIQALQVLRISSQFKIQVHIDSKYALLSLLNRREYEYLNFKGVKNADKLKQLYQLLDENGLLLVVSQGDKTNLQTVGFVSKDGAVINFRKVVKTKAVAV